VLLFDIVDRQLSTKAIQDVSYNPEATSLPIGSYQPPAFDKFYPLSHSDITARAPLESTINEFDPNVSNPI